MTNETEAEVEPLELGWNRASLFHQSFKPVGLESYLLGFVVCETEMAQLLLLQVARKTKGVVKCWILVTILRSLALVHSCMNFVTVHIANFGTAGNNFHTAARLRTRAVISEAI